MAGTAPRNSPEKSPEQCQNRPDSGAVTTRPWATAERAPLEILDAVEYPDLAGTEVMLINPNCFYRKKLFSLGLGYIATALQRCGIKVSVTDCAAWSYDDIEIAKILIQSKVKIFGIGGMYPNFREVERLCTLIRAVVPDATIILGGALPTPIPEFVLRRTGADVCTLGEAELTIPALMSALVGQGSLDEVPGIAFIREGEFVQTGKPRLPVQVTKKEVGWPALDLFPLEHYFHSPKFYPFEMTDRPLPIVTGRGCPYSCNFCYRVTASRVRPVDEVMEEMEYLIDRYKVDSFYFVDDLFMLSKKKIRQFCESIIDRGLRIKYNCSGRVNVVDAEIVRLMKESGCITVYYGIESGSQKILNNMSKKTNLEQIHEAVRLTREGGIYCTYGFMFGQPKDDAETLRDTIGLIKDISYGEYRAQKIFGCVPFPGSGLYDWCQQTGRIGNDQDFYDRYICQDWSLDQIPVNMTELPDAELHDLFAGANAELDSFYLKKMSSDWVEHFEGKAMAADSSPGSFLKRNIERTKSGGVSLEPVPPFPRTMLIELTNACNDACSFCANHKMTRRRGVLDDRLLGSILTQAHQLGTREVGLYSTGEPFAAPNLAGAVARAKSTGMEYVYITTNGALATPERARAVLEAGLDSVKFSINAATRETYRLIHGHDDFEKVLTHLKFFRDYRERHGLRLNIGVGFVLAAGNCHERELAEKLFGELADDVVFAESNNQGGYMNDRGLPAIITPPCHMIFNRFHVSWEGFFTLCCVDYQNYLAVADLNRVSVSEAWSTPAAVEMRKRHLEGRLDGTLCQNCVVGTDAAVQPLVPALATEFAFGLVGQVR